MGFKTVKSYAIAVAFALGMTLAYNHGYDKANTKWEQEVHNEYVKKVEATADKQAALNEVSRQYQEDLAALEGSTDRVINDLRNDGKRLSVRVKNLTGLPKGDGRCEFDGRAELHESDAKRIIGIAQAADAHVRALQKTIKEMQNERHPSKS
ncbi:Rz-like spanin [Escherichia phage Sekstaphage-1]|uniref:Rz-like spanin n=1 Tax=Escherichia phage Sekstaphage-1 TaxID=3076820 RepID=A0AA96PNP3_9CAUD|nr:Rz-like spanin [Escherichia phage Sekstaphage-1]